MKKTTKSFMKMKYFQNSLKFRSSNLEILVKAMLYADTCFTIDIILIHHIVASVMSHYKI